MTALPNILRALSWIAVILLAAACGEAADGPAADGSLPAVPGGGLPVTECPGQVLATPTSGTCHLTKGSASSRLLIRGTILLPDRVLKNGNLLIAADEIACVGCDCGRDPARAGAAVLDCPGGVISPGLINPHDHLGWTRSKPVRATARYDHRHEWRKGKNGKPKIPAYQVDFSADAMAWGEVRMLMSGVTSIMGEGSADNLLRNLDWDNLGLDKKSAKNTTFPLGDKDGDMLTQQCAYPQLPAVATVKSAVAWVPHVAEGVNLAARNEFLCLSGAQSSGVDVTLSNSSFIHAVGLKAVDAGVLAARGARVIWSPRSNISLYGMTADVVLLDNLGVKIALSTDWVVSGSMNMLRELACAVYLNETHYDDTFADYQIWEMATKNAALSAGVDDELGQLAAGHAADVSIFDGARSGGHAAVLGAAAGDVVLVIRGGVALYGDEALIDGLAPGSAKGCEKIDVCGVNKRLCVEREVGKTLAQLKSGLSGDSYPLFFCGAPDNEPTCVPRRPGQYDGKITAADGDGDGVADAADNCPDIFNPARPLDGDAQADADADGIGDSCDPTPLPAGV